MFALLLALQDAFIIGRENRYPEDLAGHESYAEISQT